MSEDLTTYMKEAGLKLIIYTQKLNIRTNRNYSRLTYGYLRRNSWDQSAERGYRYT